MQTNVIDLTGSTTSAHGLNEEQLAKLQPLIELVETQLLHCVDDIRQGRWTTDPKLKTRAELKLRELVLRLGKLLKVEPLTEEKRKLRTGLLTRRIRCFLRVFSNGPRKYYQGAIPDIDWNEDLMPKEFYPEEDLIAAREERDFAQEEAEMREHLRDAKERMEERTKGDRVKQRRENAERAKAMEVLMAKRLVKKRMEEAKAQKIKREEEEERKAEEQEEEDERKRKRKEDGDDQEGTKKEEDEDEERMMKEEDEGEERRRKEEEEQEEKTRKEREEKEERKRKEEEREEKRRKEREEKKERKRREEEQEEKTRKDAEEEQRMRKDEKESQKKEKDGRRKTAVVAPSQAPPTKKRSRVVKSKETIGDSDEGGQTDVPNTVHAAKKQKKQKAVPDPVDSDQPDSCQRCNRLRLECSSNGPRRACDNCRLAKKTCSMVLKGKSGSLPPTKPQAHQKPAPAPKQPPPPPPVLNPPAAPLSRQMAQGKRKRPVDDAGEAGPSKIRKVRIVVPLPKETISVKEEEANPVKIPIVRVLRAGVEPESRKVTTSAEGEKLVAQGGDSDVTLILRRLEDQDKRIRELEASESVVGKSMAKKMYVDDAVADAIHTMEQQTQDIDFEHRETRKRLDALADNSVNFLTQRFQDLETKFDKVDRLEKKIVRLAEGFDQEEKRRDEEDKRRDEENKRRDGELQAMERRLADEGIRVERSLEEQMKEQFQERDRKLVEWQSKTVSDLNSQVEESLKRLQSEFQQDWWTAELDRRAKLQTEEMKALLNQRPTLEEIGASFTTLGTTSILIGQLGDLHAKTGRDNHLLQSELHTLERLYLRQLDRSAPLVNASHQLEEMLHRQILHSPASRPPPLPIVQTNNVQPPQPQAPIQRAMSGPPTFPSGSRLCPEPPKETLRADVTMDDESGNKGLDEVKRDDGDDDSMGQGIVSHVSSNSASHDPQSPSPIRTRSRTAALQRAASAAPLTPLHATRLSPLHAAPLTPLQEEGTLLSSPLTILSDLGLSPAKSISGHTDGVMSEYINFDMTS